ncbi:MAG: RNB domain-containing ribonuclease [Verrucomicrobia bacterium]|nr:RNB domain-containing ribonuclease [Verrucomicrobiota bacterium]
MNAEETLLNFMRRPGYKPMRLEAIVKTLGGDRHDLDELRKAIPRLLKAGAIVTHKGLLLGLPKGPAGSRDDSLLEGTILFRASGSARVVFDVTPGDKPREALHIDANDTHVALHGDRVLVKLNQVRRDRNGDDWGSGTVVRVIKRALTQLTGTLRRNRLQWFVVPDDPRISREIIVRDPTRSDLKPAPKPEDKVVLKLDAWERRNLSPTGTLTEVLGVTHTPMAEYLAILRRYNLNPEFPASVVSEANSFPSTVQRDDCIGREDFRQIPTITIDPDDAKDFDDALSVQRLPNGNLRIAIHIADVSYYVKTGSRLDTEARERGNSTYLVGTVIPMLPHALSSGLCSLVEAQDRLVKTVICEFSPDAQLLKTEFANSVICSLKRLTYKQAYAFLKGDDNAQLRAMPAPPPHQTGSPGRPLSELKDDELELIRQMIGDFWKIGKILRAERFRAGSLDLDMKEIKIYCDKDGWADRTEIVTHDESHQLIEEFMLLANECVAKSLDKASIPHVCRVHDDPDPEKLAALREELAGDGFKVGDLTHRSEMVKLLSDLKTREDGYTIRIQLLRSLKQACYRPSPDGHFGLAKRHYSHFTSPIRRYADLLEHRIFDAYIAKHGVASAPKDPPRSPGLGELVRSCEHISITERNSAEAERDSVKIKILELFEREVERKDKRPFEAIITDIKPHGLMVELSASNAFGLVHMSTLTDDYYRMNDRGNMLVGSRTGRKFMAGGTIMVTVDRVDRFKRQVDFRLADDGQRKTRGPERRKGQS